MKEREPRPFERIPVELKALTQWVNWRDEDGQKVPVNSHTLGNAGVHWQNTWASFEKALQVAQQNSLGIGFVLAQSDPYTCVDLDKCVGQRGALEEQIRDILALLSGWVELSPSETGLHVWVKNEKPVNRRTKGIEIYSYARWITFTGRSNPKGLEEIPERTTEVEELLRRYFTEEKREFVRPAVTFEDEEIWQRLFASKSGSFFRSLFDGDISVCHNDHSRAVIMLANQLALVTDLDEAQVKRMLYQTGLVSEKWEEKRGTGTWIEYQIADAVQYVMGRRR